MSRSAYSEELADARRQGREAHDAIEAWLSRPIDAPDVPGEVLEAHARDLRNSRERLKKLVEEHGIRDDLEAALKENVAYHASLGLSMRDQAEHQSDPPDASMG
jgi:hypothetical protein